MAKGAPRIEIVNLTKTYRREGGEAITPVDNISLSVAEDELVVLLGPSGCGKTTLLRCVAGLERPDAGEIIIDGRLVYSAAKNIYLPPEDRAISMIFQSFALWPHMTVFDNIAYPLQSRNVKAADIPARVKAILEVAGVGGLGAQYPGRISGGQQQRVALARALVSNSSVVLFDEPLSNVDTQVRARLRFELKRIQQNIGFSGLYVTHDQIEALELGHRVAVLDRGRVAALDVPRTVYEYPNSEYVANFVGVANLWQGRVMRVDGTGLWIETPMGTLAAAPPTAKNFTSGDMVAVVVRPENLRPWSQEPAQDTGALQATVEAQMFAGPHTELVVGAAGGQSTRVWLTDHTSDFQQGQPIWLTANPAKVQVLAGAGGVQS